MRIAITGGGTGGHLSIAKSLKDAFLQKGAEVLYLGSTIGQDRSWFEKDQELLAAYFFDTQGVVNKKGAAKLQSLIKVAKSTLTAKKMLQQHNIDVVISVGGYSAAPASFAAILGNIPLFIHEQNAIKGKLNQILTPFAKHIFCSFTPPFDPYPVRSIFYEIRRVRKELKTLIFLGGSQGAKQINDLAIRWAPTLHKKGISIIHQTGTKDFNRVKETYKKMDISADIFPFDQNIAEKIAHADLAISRSGASTLWELATNLLPAIYLPYPYAAGDHQRFNALFLQKRNASILYDGQSIEEIFDLDLEVMSRNLLPLSRSDGASKIVEEILATL